MLEAVIEGMLAGLLAVPTWFLLDYLGLLFGYVARWIHNNIFTIRGFTAVILLGTRRYYVVRVLRFGGVRFLVVCLLGVILASVAGGVVAFVMFVLPFFGQKDATLSFCAALLLMQLFMGATRWRRRKRKK